MATSDDIARLYNFQRGAVADPEQVDAELDQLVNTINNKAARILSSGGQTLSANNVWSGTQTFSNTITTTGQVKATGLQVDRADDPGSPVDGQIWLNTTTNQLNARINGVTINLGTPTGATVVTPGLNFTAPPVVSSSSVFTVASINCADSTGAALIKKTTSTSVNVSTTGLNGIAQGALGGSVTVTGGSTTVTVNTPVGTCQVGDVITTAGGQSRTVSAVSAGSPTAVSVNFSSTETAVQYRRGGRGYNCWLNLYAITDGTTPGLILSTRSVANGDTLVDLPTGYTSSRQLAFAVRLNDATNITPFLVSSGWPQRPTIIYQLPVSYINNTGALTNGTANILAAGAATTWAATSTALYQPKVSKQVLLFAHNTNNNPAYIDIRASGGTGQQLAFDSLGYCGLYLPPLLSDQTLDYQLTYGSAALNLDVVGFTVTEVF